MKPDVAQLTPFNLDQLVSNPAMVDASFDSIMSVMRGRVKGRESRGRLLVKSVGRISGWDHAEPRSHPFSAVCPNSRATPYWSYLRKSLIAAHFQR
jgi:hypothetical protein